MNLSIWAFGIKSQILNENLIGDLMKNHLVRSLVELELYASPPSREEFGFQLHPEAPISLTERVKYKPNLCNQVHFWEPQSRMFLSFSPNHWQPFRAGDNRKREDISHPKSIKFIP